MSYQGIEFNSLESLEKYCKENSYVLIKHKLLFAEIRDKHNALWGYVSNDPSQYKCKNLDTKYVLVWE